VDRTVFQAYCLTCLTTGRVYIGITSRSLKRRWNEHLYASRTARRRMTIGWAIAKHGADEFRIEALCCARSWADICEVERVLIEQYDCRAPKGYNLRNGGEGVFGHTPSAEAIERSAAKHRDKPCHPNTRQAATRTHLGKPKTPEHRAKIAASRVGKPRSEATKAKVAAYWATRRATGEFKTPTPYAHARHIAAVYHP
jgi:group I intron endonuclease